MEFSQSSRIGIIGAGNMATALTRAWLATGLMRSEDVTAADPSDAARRRFTEATGARAVAENLPTVTAAEIVLLSVKPQQVASVANEIRAGVGGKLVVSILAGTKLSKLATLLPEARIIRVMPNTPCMVGQGASAFARGALATAEDAQRAKALLEAVGVAFEVEEKLLDAVTGLSGSGPAYVFMIIEALSDGGVRMGLPRAFATALAAQTLRGAATMVLAGDEHPAVLRDRVASPGGTTIAGLQVLEDHGLRAALIAAVAAATRRSHELGQD